jgi:hypothetical protein
MFCEIIFYFNNFKKEKKLLKLVEYNLKNKCETLRIFFKNRNYNIYKLQNINLNNDFLKN